jgi:hypothetical protein
MKTDPGLRIGWARRFSARKVKNSEAVENARYYGRSICKRTLGRGCWRM